MKERLIDFGIITLTVLTGGFFMLCLLAEAYDQHAAD